MIHKLQVPGEAVSFILYQRTNYLQFSNSVIYKFLYKIFPNASYKLLVNIESKVFRDQIVNRYAESMHNEYMNIKDYLPDKCESVLDIGCGVAGIDPFIAWHYHLPILFYLLDKTTTDNKIMYGYRQRASFYNSLIIAQKLLVHNHIQGTQIHLIEADDNYTVPITTHIHIVISLLAWGFHFPVNTYLEQVYSLLSDTGILILDVSKNSNGANELRKKFSSVSIIGERKDHIRILAKKAPWSFNGLS